jgi:hypothetical protein
VNVISHQPHWFGLKAKTEKRLHRDVLNDLEDAERVLAAIMVGKKPDWLIKWDLDQARKAMVGRRPVPGAKGKK